MVGQYAGMYSAVIPNGPGLLWPDGEPGSEEADR